VHALDPSTYPAHLHLNKTLFALTLAFVHDAKVIHACVLQVKKNTEYEHKASRQSAVICTVESSQGYISTWRFNCITVLIPIYVDGRGIQLQTKGCPKQRFSGMLLIFSVGNHCTGNYSWVHCTEVVLKVLEWWFVRWCCGYKIRVLLEQGDSLEGL